MSVILSHVPSCLALNCSSLWVSVQVSEPLELTQFRKLSGLHVNDFGIPPDREEAGEAAAPSAAWTPRAWSGSNPQTVCRRAMHAP